MNAPLPANEAARLRALSAYQILDTAPEQGFDDLALLASHLCGTPIALVSLVDAQRQWFKAVVGLDSREMPREHSFCAHALPRPEEVLVVSDTKDDARFADNPIVTGGPKIRFYAGAPLVTPDGEALGALCVLDQKPRTWTNEQEQALRALARQVMAQLELRRNLARLSDALSVREQIEAELRESEARFQAFMDHSPIVAFLKDAQGCYRYVNQPYLTRFGFQRDDVIGKHDFDLWPEEIMGTVREHDAHVLERGETLEFVECVPDAQGEKFWQVWKFPLRDGSDEGGFVGGVALDITKNKQHEQQLQGYQAQLEQALQRVEAESRTDALTGLNNRRAFNPRLEEEFDRARRYGSPLSLLMLDIDFFKGFNDTFGHASGDEVLQTVARLLSEKARASDFVARWGGEEFAILLPNTGGEGAFILAERIRRAVKNAPWRLRPITISVGVATFSSTVPHGAALLGHADDALYCAKRAGRNRVVGAGEQE